VLAHRWAKVFDVNPNWALRWTPDGQAITFIDAQATISRTWNQPMSGGPPKQLTNFTSEQIINFDWSAN